MTDRNFAYFPSEPVPDESRFRRKKGRKGWKTTAVILVAAILFAAAYFFLGEQPVRVTSGRGERKSGFSTVLLAGTDGDGTRTDTIVLVSVDSSAHRVGLLSIPRDTYVNAAYSVPKINSACGAAGGGMDGMEELMEQVCAVIGFMPDGYILVNLDAFVEIVDLCGGVDFDVPVDMSYCDPAQNLNIALSQGYQHLDGGESIQLVRFRSGYAMADLERVNVQRDFLRAAMRQWLSVKNIPKIPQLFSILNEDVITDLSAWNMLWLAKAMKASDLSSMATETLPGEPATISGGSYFVADSDVREVLVEQSFSPYE